MRSNCDMTWYAKSIDPATITEKYTRTQVLAVFWENRKAANVIHSGLIEADSAAVYIPFARGPLAIKIGDILVKTLVTDEITAAFTITKLKSKYPNVVSVRSVDTKDFGSSNLRHWQIGGA